MPKFLEDKLMAEYGPNNKHAVFGTMNAIGAMHGNKETSLGVQMQAKHDAKVRSVKPMHPVMRQRAAMTKEAHVHLAAAVPEYHQATPRQKILMGNHHVALRLGKAK